MKMLSSKGKITRCLLVLFTFFQANWIPLACGAVAVAAAANFGDKAYLMQLSKDAGSLITEGKPYKAVEILESNIAGYDTWRQDNLDNERLIYIDRMKGVLYFQLAVAKEGANFPKEQVKDAYLKALDLNLNDSFILAKLYSFMTEHEYKILVLEAIESSRKYNKEKKVFLRINWVDFVKLNNWSAFKVFADILLENVENPVMYARRISMSFKRNEFWAREFQKYCRSKPQLLPFILEEEFKKIDGYVEQENYSNAAMIYENILETYSSNIDSAEIKLKLYKCYFNGGDYDGVIPKLDEFIESNKASHRKLVKEAMLMKGRAYIQLGEIDKATDDFLSLMIEYPETKNASEANFFIGYCYMLQGKFDIAKEALDLVVKDYPQSSYASKARLCITRIKSMTEM